MFAKTGAGSVSHIRPSFLHMAQYLYFFTYCSSFPFCTESALQNSHINTEVLEPSCFFFFSSARQLQCT